MQIIRYDELEEDDGMREVAIIWSIVLLLIILAFVGFKFWTHTLRQEFQGSRQVQSGFIDLSVQELEYKNWVDK